MSKSAQQGRMPPIVSNGAAVAQQAGDQAAALRSAPKVEAPPPPPAKDSDIAIKIPPPPKIEIIGGHGVGVIRIANPTIELGRNEFVDIDGSGKRVQVNKLTPKLALIVGGAIVIEEMNLIIPLGGNLVRS